MFFNFFSIINSLSIPFSFESDMNKTLLLSKIQECLNISNKNLKINSTLVKKHFKTLKRETKLFRKITRPNYNDCNGPFLEEEFIRRFKDEDLNFFGGIIPIFVQWFALYKTSPRNYLKNVKNIFEKLNSKYIYMVISESDFGINGDGSNTIELPNNILIFSTSGKGHIAIPWIQCNINKRKKLNYEYYLTFCGNPLSSKQRKNSILIANSIFGNNFIIYRGNNWKDYYSNSTFGFSPRGISVGTYRTTELIRLHTIPLIITDNEHWLPYYPILNWSSFSILTTINELPNTYLKMKLMNNEDILKMQSNLAQISNKYFQWDGIFEQLKLFFTAQHTSCTCYPKYLN